MTYKFNCKINNEVAIKLAIIKQKLDWISIKKIIKNFGLKDKIVCCNLSISVIKPQRNEGNQSFFS